LQTSLRGDTTRSVNQVKFYDPFGRYLRNIRIPGDNIAGLTWEGSGKYSTVQYSAVQYSTVQCSAVQCSTVQFVPYTALEYFKALHFVLIIIILVLVTADFLILILYF
jgi:hypothetical protein